VATAAPITNPQIAMLYQRATYKQLPSQALVPGGADITIPLRKLGYTDMLIVRAHGTYHLAADCTPVFEQLPQAIVKKFLVDVPGREIPINLSGRMLRILNLRANDFGTFPADAVPEPRSGYDANTLFDTVVDKFDVVESATNDVNLVWIVPFHRSVVDHRGALPTGALDQINLVITPGAIADFLTTDNGIGTDVSAVSLVVDVTQVIFSAPPADAAIIPGSTGDGCVIKYDETTDVIEQAGIATEISIVPKDTLLAIAHAVTINGVADSTDVESLYLRVEESYFTDPNGQPAAIKTLLDAAINGSPFPEGVFVWDRDRPSTGMADWIHTDGINEIKVGIVVASGTDLGTKSNVLTGRIRLVELPAGA
jgi:hypothetical protein